LLELTEVVPDHTNPELGSRIVMLRHPETGQQLELNWYPDGGQFGVPFVPGESLDHIGVRMEDVPAFLKWAEELGGKVAELHPYRAYLVHTYATGNTAAFVEDPGGNILEVYDAPGYSMEDPCEGGY
jgi:catechol 2,3-dioxygenase-like lactoylglutathione lyase family enzyme